MYLFLPQMIMSRIYKNKLWTIDSALEGHTSVSREKIVILMDNKIYHNTTIRNFIFNSPMIFIENNFTLVEGLSIFLELTFKIDENSYLLTDLSLRDDLGKSSTCLRAQH